MSKRKNKPEEYWFVPDPSNTWRNKPRYKVEGLLHVREVVPIDGACKHPGCCCVCGHTKQCPEDGPSIVQGVTD